jgi:hypothetical protein
MALNPNIALGVRPLEIPNQLAQYAQLSQIQGAQQANQLNQMQMAEYERARAEEEGTRNFLAKADLSDPTVRSQLMTKYGKAGREIATNLTAYDKARSEDLARQAKLAQDTQAMYQNISGIISNKADAAKFLQLVVNDPAMKDSPLTKIPLMQQIARIPEDPAGLDDWKKQFALGATKYITENKPVTFAQDTGTGGRVMSRPGLSSGPATLVPGSEFTKGMTFADQNAAARLAFDKSKFEFEKANPTMSIQEDPSGLLAVNMRTGVATPVVYGPMGIQAAPAAGTAPAPAAAPGASLMRQPPAALPGQRMPAIPGMASVLDQTTAPAAPAAMPMPSTTGERVPGQPVTAKKSLPEAYAKQAMGVANTNDSLEKLLSTMKNFKSSDMLNPTRRAELGQAHATTLLFAKELFNLGVLNGGDERIVNSVINNPVDFSSTAVPIEAIRKQARDLQGVVDRTNKNLSTVYKMPLLKLDRSTPSEVANDIHSQAEAILRGTPPRGNP